MNFLQIAHTLKKKAKCLSCGYNLCMGEKKYIYPGQYKNCDHSHKFTTAVGSTCFYCGLQFKSPHGKCEHQRKKVYGLL